MLLPIGPHRPRGSLERVASAITPRVHPRTHAGPLIFSTFHFIAIGLSASLEPGGIRTDCADIAGNAASSTVLPDYADTVRATLERIRAYAGNEAGKPARIAQVIRDFACRDDVPAHLVLDTDALASFDAAEAGRRAAHEQ